MLRIGSFVMHCNDFEPTVRFWQEALHYAQREPASDGWVVLKDPEGIRPNVSIQGTDQLKFGRNRLHMDLYASDQKAEVERLIKLGARIDHVPSRGDFVVMADPEGKLFCVVQVPERT
jgi:hypothetical protein